MLIQWLINKLTSLTSLCKILCLYLRDQWDLKIEILKVYHKVISRVESDQLDKEPIYIQQYSNWFQNYNLLRTKIQLLFAPRSLVHSLEYLIFVRD